MADRPGNRIVVIDPEREVRVGEFSLLRPLRDDPTADLLDVSRSGAYVLASLRGPTPLTADPHASRGSTPRVGVIRVDDDGRSGQPVGIAPIRNVVDRGGARRPARTGRARRLRIKHELKRGILVRPAVAFIVAGAEPVCGSRFRQASPGVPRPRLRRGTRGGLGAIAAERCTIAQSDVIHDVVAPRARRDHWRCKRTRSRDRRDAGGHVRSATVADVLWCGLVEARPRVVTNRGRFSCRTGLPASR